MSVKTKKETFVVVSRIDYGSPGFRTWMLDALAQICAWEKAAFIVLNGGLLSSKDLLGPLPKGRGKKRTEDIDVLVSKTARELAGILPRIPDPNRKHKLLKWYVFTAPTSSYDGEIGSRVARALTKLRRDIRFQDEGGGLLPLRGTEEEQFIRAVLPHKRVAQLGGNVNYSVRPERFIREKRSQSSELPPVLWLTDCGATSVSRPAGEAPEPWTSIPMLSRPMETITTENQVGVRVVEFSQDSNDFTFKTYNLKDFLQREREMIPTPKGLSEIQAKIFAALKANGLLFIGQLEHMVGSSRTAIKKAIDEYNETRKPLIEHDETNERYGFELKWLQRDLKCTLPDPATLPEDRLVAYSCLHAGSAFTEYEFFVNSVAQLLIETEARSLVSAGDNIQGLYHDLDLRGEIVPGFNSYTAQEELSGRLNARVILAVFNWRYDQAVKEMHGKRLSPDKLAEIIEFCLIYFYFRMGNHDDWQTRTGHEPLAIFRREIIDRVIEGIENRLMQDDLMFYGLKQLVDRHIVYTEKAQLPSGLCMEIFHPYKGRTMASSQRAQEVIKKSDCQVIVEGNFHVAVAVEHWDPKIGQQVGLQVGTILWMSNFEKNIIKKLDVGVGYLAVRPHNGRVFVSEIKFVGEGVKNPDRGPAQAREFLYNELNI